MAVARQEIGAREAAELLRDCSGKTLSNLRLPARVRWKIGDLRDVTFNRIVFNGAVMSGRLFRRGAVLRGTFLDADLDDLRCDDIDFTECRFDDVSFGERHVGSMRGCTFTGCVFSGCRFDHVSIERSTFRKCRLENVKGSRTMWRACTFEELSLTGQLSQSNFVSTAFRGADLSGAFLEDCAILDSREVEVALPEEASCFVVVPKDLGRASQQLADKVSAEALAALGAWIESDRSGREDFVVVSEVFFEDVPARDREVVREALFDVRFRRRPDGG